MQQEHLLKRAHWLIRLRLLGWALLGAWPVLSLISEFVYVIDLESQPVRVAGKILGVLGLVVIAYGFERFAEVSHRLAGLHD